MWKIRRLVDVISLAVISVALLSGAAVASSCHGQNHSDSSANMKHNGMSHSMPMDKRSLQSQAVQGLVVSLEVMEMDMHVQMQAMEKNRLPDELDKTKTHALMLWLKDPAGKEVRNAAVNFTVVSPMGKEEKGKLVWSGNHYGAGINIDEEGSYQMKFFIQSDGEKREAKFVFEEK